MSFVEVLPVEPVIATTRADERSRTAPAIAASAATCVVRERAPPPRRARARARRSPRPPPTATNRSPSSIRRESTWSPVTTSAHGRAMQSAERLDDVELERDHAAAPARRGARATSRSSNGIVAAGDLHLAVGALARDHDDVAGLGVAERRLDRGAPVERSISSVAAGDLLRRSRPDPRSAGCRSSRSRGRRASARRAPISGRFSRSRSPPAPKTTISRPSPSAARRCAARSRASPVCARSRRSP